MTTITLHEGDNRVTLRRLIDQGVRVHSVCTDPPYGLVSVTKRFGADKATPAKYGTDGAFQRVGAGFMGSKWDGTGIERDPEFWRLIHDILLPGGYVLAFSSPRTGHWQACAMETAGFVMHPFLGWLYGQGMPKAHNAAMAIDKHLGVKGGRGAPRSAAHAGWIERGQMRGDEGHDGWQRPWMEDAEKVADAASRYLPASPEAQQWDGWSYGGQALKPALEPIYVGQRPFDGKNGALNFLKHGVGAINIDATRVSCGAESNRHDSTVYTCGEREVYRRLRSDHNDNLAFASSLRERLEFLLPNDVSRVRDCLELLSSQDDYRFCSHSDDELFREIQAVVRDVAQQQLDAHTFPDRCATCGHSREDQSKPCGFNTTRNVERQGRHPANLIHDGSDDVVALFPQSAGQLAPVKGTEPSRTGGEGTHCYGEYADRLPAPTRGDSGSAARFFNECPPDDAQPVYYHGKATRADRVNRHYEEVNIEWTSEAGPCQAQLLVDMGQSLPRVIGGSESITSSEWSTFLSGNVIMDLFLTASKFIIETETNSTTNSAIWNCWTRSLTSESTVDAPSPTASGSNLVENAVWSNQSLTITLGETVSLPGANRALSGTQLKLSASGKLGGHPTVKPITLMRWLVRLVTPKGGVVLDPFGGSGTTGEAARQEGFECVLMEADERFAADIRARFGLAGGACSAFDDLLGGGSDEDDLDALLG